MRKKISWLLTLSMLLVLVLAAIPARAEESYVKLTWAQGTGADAPADVAEVNEALNVISREKLGVEVDIQYFDNDRLRTSILAGEVFDMYFTCDWFNDYVTQSYAGIFADLTEVIKTETPDLYATMPEEVWELAKVDGKLYAIPVKKDYCPEVYAIFDKALFEELGMEIPPTMKYTDLTPYLEAFKTAYPDRYPMMRHRTPGGMDATFDYINRDALIGFPYAAAGTEDATKIVSVFEDPEMVEKFYALHEWYKAGYINPDASTTEETSLPPRENFIRLGQGFYGADAIWSSSYQYATQISRISGPYLSAIGVRGSMNALSSTLESDPERLALALKYQELVNTDQQYRDILRYGIEGKHFVYNDNGTVTQLDAGLDNYSPWAFSQGSYALSSVVDPKFEGVEIDVNMWDVVFEGYEDAIVAADLGFAFDPSDWEMEIAQLTVIREKWLGQICTGTLDPAESLPAVIAEMEAAGLREVIAGAQEQLDAYLAAKAAL